jgi:ribosomal RNA-processing protein 36
MMKSRMTAIPLPQARNLSVLLRYLHACFVRFITSTLTYSQESDPDDLEIDQDMEIGSVSFGALAKAQSSIRIRMNSSSAERQEVPHWQAQKTRHNQDSRDHIGEELPRKERKEAFGRSSKHAPTELSSKKAVSRRREAVMVPKRESRDPRFDPLTGPLDEGKTKKNYAFLESYREIEMKSIRDEIRRAKDDAVKETLKKELSSMVSIGIMVFRY